VEGGVRSDLFAGFIDAALSRESGFASLEEASWKPVI
jgi:hypothetical protein